MKTEELVRWLHREAEGAAVYDMAEQAAQFMACARRLEEYERLLKDAAAVMDKDEWGSYEDVEQLRSIIVARAAIGGEG